MPKERRPGDPPLRREKHHSDGDGESCALKRGAADTCSESFKVFAEASGNTILALEQTKNVLTLLIEKKRT